VGGRPESDQQLIDRARGGDARAYDQLVRRHQQLAFRTACVLTGSPADAEECVQDGFVKAWSALGRFRPGAEFRPWLLAIVANEARARRRAMGRRRAWTERAAHDERWTPSRGEAGVPSAEATVLERERRATLVQALARLPERDREVIELRYLLDLPEADIAAALGCRRGTVKSRLSRALEHLRGELPEERP
jgi:RNA polymerase sigma factor (sigma-70 family)